jgi:phosphoribosylamine-glycine ligase
MTAARAVAERAADAVSWEGLQRRRDIAADEPALATTPGPVPATTAGAAR